MGQGYVKLERLEVLVLDEADRMLDMGFIHDVAHIAPPPPLAPQPVLFPPTSPADIQALANSVLRDPVSVAVTPVASTVETIQQSVYFVEKADKPRLLEHLLRDSSIKRVLVFTRTKHGANKVVTQLGRASIFAQAIHGNKSQSAREQALANFKGGSTRVLVATDIAARGIDVDDITHVINYDLPNEPKSYVHRIERTWRAGESGIAYSFCDADERAYLIDIERLIRMHIPKAANHPFASELALPPVTDLTRGGRSTSQPRAASQPRRSSQNSSQNNQRGPRRT